MGHRYNTCPVCGEAPASLYHLEVAHKGNNLSHTWQPEVDDMGRRYNTCPVCGEAPASLYHLEVAHKGNNLSHTWRPEGDCR